MGACYFETTFTLLGFLAKADGRISEEEIAQAEALMARMGLTAQHRQQAIGFLSLDLVRFFIRPNNATVC